MIKTISDGFLALFKDLKFEVDNECVYVPKKNSENFIILNNFEDYKFMFEQLTKFTLASEDIRIFNIRYGLESGKACTLHECGQILGVTDECVRNKLKTSMRRIKHYTNMQSVFARLPLTERGQQLLENHM